MRGEGSFTHNFGPFKSETYNWDNYEADIQL